MNAPSELPPRVFGTDGVRARFGEGALAGDAVARLLTATARVLESPERFSEDFPAGAGDSIVVGRDTRASGGELLAAMGSVFPLHGYDVLDLGVLPTPGVAHVAKAWDGVALGVVLSASHNPAEYNGIKFFSPTGAKISPEFERAVEAEIARLERMDSADAPQLVDRSAEARELYVAHLVELCWRPERLAGRRICLDAAHGATYEVAPEVFRRLGMDVTVVGDQPDGKNINDGVGALHPEALAELAARQGAALGLCFDGDGDRMIPVGGRGTVFDGDFVLALAGRRFRADGQLPNAAIVATVMSNVGLELSLREAGIELLRTDVGDRNVYLEMLAGNHPIGGEQSGHTIFIADGRTGDGILSGIRLLDVLSGGELDLETEAQIMTRLPQTLQNVTVEKKRPFEELAGVLESVAAVESELGDSGRVLLRYSGTEPLARVMVEAPTRALAESSAGSICAAIRRAFE